MRTAIIVIQMKSEKLTESPFGGLLIPRSQVRFLYGPPAIFPRTDEGSASGTPGMPLDRESYQTNTTQWLLDCDNLDALGTQISTCRQVYPILAAIADKDGAVSFECDLDDYRKVPPTANGLVVQTNHYVDPTWGRPIPSDPTFTTVKRYENLVTLANDNKGRINADEMKKMMDTPIDQGGAFRPKETITQFVFVPATFDLWLKAADYQDWVEVPLGQLFKESERK